MTAEEMMFSGMHKGTDMSSYEHFAIADKASRRASGTSIAAITIGSAGLLTAIGAWVFGGVFANAKSNSNQRAIDLLANAQLQERLYNQNYTLQNQPSLKNYIDIATGGASANASSLSQAEALALLLNHGGNGQVCPQPVALYQPAMPCSCNTCGNC